MVFGKGKKKKQEALENEAPVEEEMIDLPNEEEEKKKEIAALEAKIARLEKEKAEPIEELEEVPEIEPAKQEQVPIPQTRMVYLTDSEAIRQILAEIQSLRFIVEQEIAKE